MTAIRYRAAATPQEILRRAARSVQQLPLTAKIGGTMVAFVVFVAIFAPWLMTDSPTAQSMIQRNRGFSARHWLGTDGFGRDLYSRLVLGTRYTLMISVSALTASAVAGIFIGMLAAYNRGGRFDLFVTWMIDVVMTFPTLILGVIAVAIFGHGMVNVGIAIAIAFLPRLTRMARGVALSIVTNEYIEAARAIGASRTRIVLRHLLPNIMSEMAAMTALWLGTAIEVEASLSFLGLGVQPPLPSWGLMIKEGIGALFTSPLQSLLPVAAILFVIFGINLLVDGIQEATDPNSRDR